MQKKKVIIEDINKIYEYLEGRSDSIINMMNQNKECEYILFQKYISHSDLISSGKRLGKDQSVEKNYLYYISNEKMLEMYNLSQANEDIPTMESAKQSNIGMPKEFYEKLEIPILKRREGHQTQQHEHIKLTDYAKVFLVNDTLKYFNIDYTKLVFEKLNKNVDWNADNYRINLSNQEFTPIEITYAIHGLGTKEDVEFHKLRRNIFKTDSFICLVKINIDTHEKELYIMLEKNPIFFTIIGQTNSQWENYLKIKNIKDLQKLVLKEKLTDEEEIKSRKLQSKWKDMLAAEMMNYTSVENEVFCPFTYITADYNNMKTLYRASHIKEYAICNAEEAFDINNGLLLCANADALFDKHLITIDENKNIEFSFLLDNDQKLKSMLRLNNEIFKTVLNDKRMEYLKEHREKFQQKEAARKLGDLTDSILTEEELN